jgi:hypothetical protein
VSVYERLVQSDDDIWRAYNTLLLSEDTSRLRKLLVRYRIYELTRQIPGDIVECGVYKGAGLMTWAKFLHLFEPHSRKKVIGFDYFGPFRDVAIDTREAGVPQALDEISGGGIQREEVERVVNAAGLGHRVELIEGHIEQTSANYVANNFGFRISLLHLDLDVYAATLSALEQLWPQVSQGGVILMDEYGLRGFGETQAVDEFFSGKDVQLLVVPFSETPTAYVTKR